MAFFPRIPGIPWFIHLISRAGSETGAPPHPASRTEDDEEDEGEDDLAGNLEGWPALF